MTAPFWHNALANGLILGIPAWLLLLLPFAALTACRAWRRQGPKCVHCGYPIGDADRCAECGTRLPKTAADNQAAVSTSRSTASA